MEELVEYLAKGLVDKPEDVRVERVEKDGALVLELRVAPERQVGLDPLLDRYQPELLQGGDLPLGEGLVGELG